VLYSHNTAPQSIGQKLLTFNKFPTVQSHTQDVMMSPNVYYFVSLMSSTSLSSENFLVCRLR